jgi:hypothetical protein
MQITTSELETMLRVIDREDDMVNPPGNVSVFASEWHVWNIAEAGSRCRRKPEPSPFDIGACPLIMKASLRTIVKRPEQLYLPLLPGFNGTNGFRLGLLVLPCPCDISWIDYPYIALDNTCLRSLNPSCYIWVDLPHQYLDTTTMAVSKACFCIDGERALMIAPMNMAIGAYPPTDDTFSLQVLL